MNAGCPSSIVAGENSMGKIKHTSMWYLLLIIIKTLGAEMMKNPQLTAECCHAMCEAAASYYCSVKESSDHNLNNVISTASSTGRSDVIKSVQQSSSSNFLRSPFGISIKCRVGNRLN